jgi:hypothetical protein
MPEGELGIFDAQTLLLTHLGRWKSQDVTGFSNLEMGIWMISMLTRK